MPHNLRSVARVLLAIIRLINGVLALFAPQMIIRRFYDEEAEDPAVARYALRMFGIRTILIALDLLRGGERRSQAIRAAPIIHASDAIAAVIAARSGLVPSTTGRLIVVISTVNTLLALAMQGKEKRAAEDERA